MERESSSQNRRASMHGHTFDLARRMGISKDLEGISKEEVVRVLKEEAGADADAEASSAAPPGPSMAAEPAHHEPPASPPPARPGSAGSGSLEPASFT